jgi:putative hemolysin
LKEKNVATRQPKEIVDGGGHFSIEAGPFFYRGYQQNRSEAMFTIGKNSFVVANSNNLRNAVYRLRYKVYVEEFGFEKAEDHLEGYEIDEYDSDSIHFAALNENQEVIGTLRMILNSRHHGKWADFLC